LLAPLVSLGLSYGMSALSPEFLPGIVTSTDTTTVLIMGLSYGLLGGGLLEELGGTGFAVPRLRQRHGVMGEDDPHNYEEGYLRARIIGAMGGRAAEEVVYGSRTTGAENDIQQANGLARQMVTRWGMSEKVGPMSLGGVRTPTLPVT
jgi:hypothetical protein